MKRILHHVNRLFGGVTVAAGAYGASDYAEACQLPSQEFSPALGAEDHSMSGGNGANEDDGLAVDGGSDDGTGLH